MTLGAVNTELRKAEAKFPPFNSAHEGYAVIREELDELWDLIKTYQPSKERMREEAIQVAAMAVRFVRDVCGDSEQAADDAPADRLALALAVVNAARPLMQVGYDDGPEEEALAAAIATFDAAVDVVADIDHFLVADVASVLVNYHGFNDEKSVDAAMDVVKLLSRASAPDALREAARAVVEAWRESYYPMAPAEAEKRRNLKMSATVARLDDVLSAVSNVAEQEDGS